MRGLNMGKETQAPQIRDEFCGTTITLTTKTARRYEGVIASTAGVTLKDIDNLQSDPADAKIPVPNGDCECIILASFPQQEADSTKSLMLISILPVR
ncbi:uncharacterized protein EDB91DRAFT_1245601 [Suillus paluster]|uniref:uncharacterized protein n=1 Tax=Suillus paluster TaxID=48578 RepID=UPI001B87393A|nr:uncharacterized protein EDB91DRAFT_1245601 [Suillus paluster]KAG1747156.1 hypothetical protein EDB91DRAFT_1245601 [Suillus paluster]